MNAHPKKNGKSHKRATDANRDQQINAAQQQSNKQSGSNNKGDKNKNNAYKNQSGGGDKNKNSKGEAICFVFSDTGACAKEEKCKFSHELNMIDSKKNIEQVKQLSSTIDKNGKTIIVGDIVRVELKNKTNSPLAGLQGQIYAIEGVNRKLPEVFCKMQILNSKAPRRCAKMLEDGITINCLVKVEDENNKHQVNEIRQKVSRVLFDSGASLSLFRDACAFASGSIDCKKGGKSISVADATSDGIKTLGEGDVLIETEGEPIKLPSHHSPSIEQNFISIPQLCDLGYETRFKANKGGASIWRRGRKLLDVPRGESSIDEQGDIIPGMFYLPHDKLVIHSTGNKHFVAGLAHTTASKVQVLILAHEALAHFNIPTIAKMLGITCRETIQQAMMFCKPCALAKITDKSSNKVTTDIATRVNYRVFIDCCGPFEKSIQDNYIHFVSFHDEFSQHTDVELLKARADVVTKVKFWITNANARHEPHKLVELRCDGAPEFNSNAFKKWLQDQGIRLLPGVRYAHHHQGQVERAQRTLEDCARASRVAAGLPKNFWPYAVAHAKRAKEIVPSSRAPFAKLLGVWAVPLDSFGNRCHVEACGNRN